MNISKRLLLVVNLIMVAGIGSNVEASDRDQLLARAISCISAEQEMLDWGGVEPKLFADLGETLANCWMQSINDKALHDKIYTVVKSMKSKDMINGFSSHLAVEHRAYKQLMFLASEKPNSDFAHQFAGKVADRMKYLIKSDQLKEAAKFYVDHFHLTPSFKELGKQTLVEPLKNGAEWRKQTLLVALKARSNSAHLELSVALYPERQTQSPPRPQKPWWHFWE